MRIFRAELTERSQRLVAGARALAERRLERNRVEDLIRDAHTIKGSAGLLGIQVLKEAGAALESAWRRISEGATPPREAIVALEATAGRLDTVLDTEDHQELVQLIDRINRAATEPATPGDIVALRHPDYGSLDGLLASVSDSLLSGATRVDTGDLYRMINRIVEVSLDAEALADLSLVTIEGADPSVFRKTWRTHLQRLAASIADIQDQAVSLANVPFFDAISTYPQFVRYLGRRLGKDVRVEILGEDVDLDRQIIDLIREPLRQLLVNAVDHGIESSADRVAAAKSETGVVQVSAEVVDDRVEISVTDDGAGIDWERVADLAAEKGLAIPGRDLTPLVLERGFTTAGALTDFSGSGDGLAQVLEAVEQVSGGMRIDSAKGKGTRVTLTLPLSMVLQNVVIVAIDDQFWGLPEAAVEAAMPLSRAEIGATTSGRELRFQSGAIPVVSLSTAIGLREAEDESELLIVNTRSGPVAVTVSEIVDRRRVAVKNLGPILEGAGHVTGAALLGGGQVLVVLDPNFLGAIARQRPRAAEDKPRVLVVDDSAGVRQLLAATLNGAGFEVEVAGSAREAVLAMAGDGFDAMVVDYSMPRSNGVELVRAMRAAEVRVPIVMVSGVATPEEKAAAWDVGVDAYLDKFDLRHGVLTKTLRQLIGLEGDAGQASG